jgi:hypothetical protein
MSEKFTETNPAAVIAALWHDTSGDIAPDEVTLDQMADTWGISTNTADVRLAQMVKAGKLSVRKGRRAGDGHIIRVWRVNNG